VNRPTCVDCEVRPAVAAGLCDRCWAVQEGEADKEYEAQQARIDEEAWHPSDDYRPED
jgi:hypothetical protein